jgi:hypothetical protein
MGAPLINDKTIKAVKGLVITVGVMAAIGIASYLIYRKIKVETKKADSKDELKDSNSELNNVIVQGQKPTLSPSQISQTANSLFSAMDGYGTNWNIIVKEFAKINNYADLLSVIKSFGVRTIDSGRFNPTPNFVGTLAVCLKDELSSERITALNNMLARKGIKSRL